MFTHFWFDQYELKLYVTLMLRKCKSYLKYLFYAIYNVICVDLAVCDSYVTINIHIDRNLLVYQFITGHYFCYILSTCIIALHYNIKIYFVRMKMTEP